MIPIHEPRKGLSLSIRIQVQEGGLEIFPRGTGLDRENGGGTPTSALSQGRAIGPSADVVTV